MKRLVALSLMFAGLLALLAACGGGDDDSDSADNGAPQKKSPAAARNEDEFARSMLLTVSDFPTGWTETPDDDDEPSPFDKCLPDAFKEGRTGRAESGTFSRGSSDADIGHVIEVYQDSAQAQKAISTVPETVKCMVAAINDGKLNDKEAEFSKAELGVMSFPKLGDRTEAFSVKFRAKAKGQSGPFSEANGYISFVFVSNGRVAYSVSATDVITAPDADLLETQVKKANAKIRQ